ncbi:nitrate ABC transporter substrate-binding protein, partial [Geobacillus thermodenitrificans]
FISIYIEAYRNSAQWMIDHPEEAASLAVKYAIDGKDEKRNLQIIQLRNASSVSPLTEEKGLGTLDGNVLQQAADTYKQLGLIKNDINMAEVVTNELLPKQ